MGRADPLRTPYNELQSTGFDHCPSLCPVKDWAISNSALYNIQRFGICGLDSVWKYTPYRGWNGHDSENICNLCMTSRLAGDSSRK